MKRGEALGFSVWMHCSWNDFADPILHPALYLVGSVGMGSTQKQMAKKTQHPPFPKRAETTRHP
ncbi:MAG: hypothetical protein RMK89_03095 [Armatimonadota bacterium]|nr:hypothetical protein [Armatimonadota bacterium]MDW8142430.1 hypothetical protein [Armatimonadota bacterium]